MFNSNSTTNPGVVIVIDSACQRAPEIAVIFGFKWLAELLKFEFPSLFQTCYSTNLEVYSFIMKNFPRDKRGGAVSSPFQRGGVFQLQGVADFSQERGVPPSTPPCPSVFETDCSDPVSAALKKDVCSCLPLSSNPCVISCPITQPMAA